MILFDIIWYYLCSIETCRMIPCRMMLILLVPGCTRKTREIHAVKILHIAIIAASKKTRHAPRAWTFFCREAFQLLQHSQLLWEVGPVPSPSRAVTPGPNTEPWKAFESSDWDIETCTTPVIFCCNLVQFSSFFQHVLTFLCWPGWVDAASWPSQSLQMAWWSWSRWQRWRQLGMESVVTSGWPQG